MRKIVPIFLLIVLFGIAGWYFFTSEPAAVHDLPPPVRPSEPVTEQPTTKPMMDDVGQETMETPEPEPAPDPLPDLNESDPEITREVAGVVGVDPLEEYLVKSQVISRMVATIDSLSGRQVPLQLNPVKPVDGVFKTTTEGETIVLNAENFSRYDGHVSLLRNMDSASLVSLYRKFYPLIQQAWEENGGEGSFEIRLLEVIDELLQTPDVPGPIQLVKPEAFYLYAEPELEAMPAGQKILVRMGSINASLVKEKLLELKQGIEDDM